MYTPRVPPSAEGDRLRWLVEEFRAINTHLNTKSVPIWRIAQTHVTPDKPRDGDVRYCDGTDLDFGHGIGPYIYEEADSAWHPMFGDFIFDLECFCPDKPTASMLVLATVFARKVIFPANLAGSYARLVTTATGTTTFVLTANGTTFGAMSFAASTTGGTFSTTAKTFSAGDTLKVIAPGTPDATAADLHFVFKGTR